jgi:hypothetical protein
MKVESAGFAEVILYFNVRLNPHAQVKDEMERFCRRGHAGLRRVAAERFRSPSPLCPSR